MRHAIAAYVAWTALGAVGCSHVAGSTDEDGRDAAVDGGFDPRECEGGRARTFYSDRDGDGFGVPGLPVMHGCDGEEASEGFASNGRDCDDADPRRQLALFVDGDGDGFGDSRGTACVAADADGYSHTGDDCDDADAMRSPDAAEGWFDGEDSDCDGRDNPGGCVELPLLESIPVETAEDCDDSADLYLAIANGCPVCGGGIATVVVANAGAVAAAFRVTTNDGEVEVTSELAPQEVAEPLTLRFGSPGSAIRVTPIGGVPDCRPDNDEAALEVGFVDCE